MIDEREMAECLSEFLAIPLAGPTDYPAAHCGPAGLTPEFIARAQALPLRETADGHVLAMADPTDDYTLKAVRLAAGGAVLPWAAVPSELKAAVARLYGDGAVTNGYAPANGAARADVRRLADLASEEPAIRYVNGLIAEAAAQRGLVDKVVDADGLMEDAMAVARELALLSPPAFAQAKRQLRQEVAERIACSGAATDKIVTEIWAAPETLGHIRAYVARTLNKA